MQDKDRPILNYATVPEKTADAFPSAMETWRLVALVSLAISASIAGFAPAVTVFPLLITGAATIITLIYMTRAAARAFGRAYAMSHLFLAVLMLPICLLGLLVIPSLVQSDIHRQRNSGSGGL